MTLLFAEIPSGHAHRRLVTVAVVVSIIRPCSPQACAASLPGAVFRVTAARPTFTCGTNQFPVGATSAPCYTTSNGTCITDGPGNYGDGERCTIEVLQTTRFIVNSLAVEGGDYFTAGTARLDSRSELEGRALSAGSLVNWRSDGSNRRAGWVLCAAPQCATQPQNASFQVTRSIPTLRCVGGDGPSTANEGTCFTTNGGSCITDGPGSYANGERCTISILRDTRLVVQFLTVEVNSDYFTINQSLARLDTAAELDSVLLTAGSSLNWRSDPSTTRAGWRICASLPCGPRSANAVFEVTNAVPIHRCVGGGGPSTAAEGSCYTTNNGTCITDGPGNFQSNERCTIRLLQDTRLIVHNLQVQLNLDFFTVNQSLIRLDTVAELDSVLIYAGSTLSWTASAAHQFPGWEICGSPNCSPLSPTAYFEVSTASPTHHCVGGGGPMTETEGTCFTTADGACVTNGPMTNNTDIESCTIRVLRSTVLRVPSFNANPTTAFFTLNGATVSGFALSAMHVQSGTTLTWSKQTAAGGEFLLCATTDSPTRAPTAAPTASPSAQPTESPSTVAPTHVPTTVPSSSPTSLPTRSPSENPTATPTRSPSDQPTTQPTRSPTFIPTTSPSALPPTYPTSAPTTRSPTTPTAAPSPAPSLAPVASTRAPSASALQSSSSSGDSGMLIIIGVALAVLLWVCCVGACLARRRRSKPEQPMEMNTAVVMANYAFDRHVDTLSESIQRHEYAEPDNVYVNGDVTSGGPGYAKFQGQKGSGKSSPSTDSHVTAAVPRYATPESIAAAHVLHDDVELEEKYDMPMGGSDESEHRGSGVIANSKSEAAGETYAMPLGEVNSNPASCNSDAYAMPLSDDGDSPLYVNPDDPNVEKSSESQHGGIYSIPTLIDPNEAGYQNPSSLRGTLESGTSFVTKPTKCVDGVLYEITSDIRQSEDPQQLPLPTEAPPRVVSTELQDKSVTEKSGESQEPYDRKPQPGLYAIPQVNADIVADETYAEPLDV
eukprot:m.252859 g.252859  ORF g.252859 m.252859 type:complete len:1001 (-) comp15924_c0_seq2:2267-5269(-)